MPSPNVNANPSRERRLEVVTRFFELMHGTELDAWAELWAEDGRILVPYPPDGFPSSIDGKATIVEGFRTLIGGFREIAFEWTGVYVADDSDAVCVEYTVEATLVSGARYTNSNICVFRFQDGLIAAYHDYFDPRRFQVVVDALPRA